MFRHLGGVLLRVLFWEGFSGKSQGTRTWRPLKKDTPTHLGVLQDMPHSRTAGVRYVWHNAQAHSCLFVAVGRLKLVPWCCRHKWQRCLTVGLGISGTAQVVGWPRTDRVFVGHKDSNEGAALAGLRQSMNTGRLIRHCRKNELGALPC